MPDVDSRVAVSNYCRMTFGGLKTVNNGWIALREGEPPAVHYDMRRADVRRLRAQGYMVRHPDVMLCEVEEGGSVKRVAVIEVDGSVHERKSERTYRRNRDYEDRGIPIMPIADSEVSTGEGWKERVDEFVADAWPEVLE